MIKVEVAGRYSNSQAPLEALLSHLPNWQRTDRPLGPQRSPYKIILRLGPEAIKNLTADYLAGAPTRELAARYGIAKTTVINLLLRQGIPLRPRGQHAKRRAPAPQAVRRGGRALWPSEA